MKKTIAILLVLVIGMVGVWAAVSDAKLHLTTAVAEFSEMLITADSNEPNWATFENSLVENSASYTSNSNRKSIDPYEDDAQDVGYIHTRTNRRGGYTITVTGAALSSTEGTTVQTISYEIYNTPADTPSTAIFTVGDPSPAIFVQEEIGTGMRAKKTAISVRLLNVGNDLSSGTYTGNITFAYTGN